ncbi:MAG: ethanolamine ammonia-lyase reactivating factor EutA [Bacillota bacterium]
MQEQGEVLTSVGIDVGTATTKIIFSRLRFRNLGMGLGVPRVRLAGREILWRSQVRATPVAGDRLLADQLLEYLHRAYAEAGIDPASVGSGGVIITGEAARKENARQLLEVLSRTAGQFVVATAGPHLEAIIAGRGSGAAARSEQIGGVVAGVDIGGGTTNIAIFRAGHVVDTACLNLGGKGLRIDPATGQIRAITPAAQTALAARGVSRSVGQALDLSGLRRTGEALAEAIAGALALESPPREATGLYDGQPLHGGYRIAEVLISGGVAEALYRPEPASLESALRHGDIGPALGWALRSALEGRSLRVGAPVETTFATVIGVGVHTLNLSGSTIRLPDPERMPLTDIPVIRPFPSAAPADRAGWAAALARHLAWLEPEGPVAVAVAPLADLSYEALSQVAAGIREGASPYLDRISPLVVVAEQDVASSLGAILSLGGLSAVIAIDELQVADGNFIDIGRPLYNGAVVPVVVKTLVFAS